MAVTDTDRVIGGVLLRPGTRLVVAEADYLYGVGRVVVLVTSVERVYRYDNDDWAELRAVQVMHTGARVDRDHRGARRRAAAGGQPAAPVAVSASTAARSPARRLDDRRHELGPFQ